MRLLVSGYQAMDLGIFHDKDPRLKVIREAIHLELEYFLNNGLEWLIFTGNLGFEYWVLEEALHLKDSYGIKLSCILPFETHGKYWNEANQEKLARFKNLDFVKFAYKDYKNPKQLRDYQQFLIDHTDGAYLFYDPEHETRLKYLYDMICKEEGYDLFLLSYDRLNEVAENFENFDR